MRRTHAIELSASSPRVGELWRRLEARADSTYFLSWGFVETWLEALPPEAAPTLIALFDSDEPVAAFFLGHAHLRRHGFVPSRALYLNTTGVPRWDELTLEHNQVLVPSDATLSLSTWVDSLPGSWDELFLPALAADRFPGSALGARLSQHVVRIDREVLAPYVDLARVRGNAGGYLALLGATTRSHIRRAERGFGSVTLDVAQDEEQALDIYDELVQLHLRRWRDVGVRGAFADPWFDAFHRRLIAKRFRHGEIQLLCARAGGETLGALYNFVWRGRVSFYQSGFAHFDDPRRKPGYVCHAHAVGHNAAAGHAVYDFLGGASRYKQSLSTDRARLLWARIQRPLARFALEERMRSWSRLALAHSGTRG